MTMEEEAKVDTEQQIKYATFFPSSQVLIPPVDEEDGYVPLNHALLRVRQTNAQRRTAEMVCNFFNIPPSRTFRASDI